MPAIYVSCMYGLVTALSSTFFFFNDTATTEIYTLSLHDALPISQSSAVWWSSIWRSPSHASVTSNRARSEEHTSELQSRLHLVCRLLLEKKKKKPHRPVLAGCDTEVQYAHRVAQVPVGHPVLSRH